MTDEQEVNSSLLLLAHESQLTNELLKNFLGATPKPKVSNADNSRLNRNSLLLSNENLASNSHASIAKQPTEVYVKFALLSLDEINTKTQSFTAEVLVQLKWENDELEDLEESQWAAYCQSCWLPQVKLFNLIKQDVHRQHVFITDDATPNNQLMLVMRQKIKGRFQINMELSEFPFDRQELTITIYSQLPSDTVVLVEDMMEYSYINRDSVRDPPEWQIFDHVETFEGNPQLIKPPKKTKNTNLTRKNASSSFLSARMRIKRRPGFYVYNVLLSMMMLVIISFAPFAIVPDGVQWRLMTTLTLLLTTFTFRNMVAGFLPAIPYFTMLDKYLLGQTAYLSMMVTVYALLVVFYRNFQHLSFQFEITVLLTFFSVQFMIHATLYARYLVRARRDFTFILTQQAKYDSEVRKKQERAGPRRRLSTYAAASNANTAVNVLCVKKVNEEYSKDLSYGVKYNADSVDKKNVNFR